MCEKQQTRQAVGLFYSSWPEKKLKEADVIVLWLTAVSFVVRAVLFVVVDKTRKRAEFVYIWNLYNKLYHLALHISGVWSRGMTSDPQSGRFSLSLGSSPSSSTFCTSYFLSLRLSRVRNSISE